MGTAVRKSDEDGNSSINHQVISNIHHEINILKEYSQKHERVLNKLEISFEHLNRELIKREAETPWIIKAIEEPTKKPLRSLLM